MPAQVHIEVIGMYMRITAVCAALLLCGCEKAMQDMYNQPKYKPLATSTLWRNGQSARPDEPATIARSAGASAATSSGRFGEEALPERAAPIYPLDESGHVKADLLPQSARPDSQVNPLPVTMELLKRGQERFNIYCSPFHSEAGDGDGMVARRGFPHPPTYHSDKLRKAPDSHIYGVITNGYGVMYSYADRVDPPDRWAIVAYIRALQLSQHASAADMPAEARSALEKSGK